MAKKCKAQKPEAKIPVDPKAAVFQVGNEIVVQRRVLWTGYRGSVVEVDGGMCRCRIWNPLGLGKGRGSIASFHADIPATELELDYENLEISH